MAGELYINNRLIDIDETLPFPLTFNISDIRDLSSRKGNKSKTITIPGTNSNCAIFRSIFLLTYTDDTTSTNSAFLDFDPSVKATARYYNNGILEFNGVAQLQECKLKNGTWNFDVTLVSDTIDYIGRLNKVKINELDFSEYNHALTMANQTETWTGFNQINGVSTSIMTGMDWNGEGYYLRNIEKIIRLRWYYMAIGFHRKSIIQKIISCLLWRKFSNDHPSASVERFGSIL
jgi:hypothetical protein